MANIVYTSHTDVDIQVNSDDALEAINIAICGEPRCNKIVHGQIVAAFPPDIDARIQQAHYRVRQVRKVRLWFDVTDAGDVINICLSQGE